MSEHYKRNPMQFLKPGTAERTVVWIVQLGIFALSGVGAFLLRFDLTVPQAYLAHLAYSVCIWILAKVVLFQLAGLDRGWWQYVSLTDLFRIAMANIAASVISCIAIIVVAPPGFPRSLYLLDLILCFLGTVGLRVLVRMAAETGMKGATGKNTLIYGAGDAGVTLLREIRRNPKLEYRICGFIDDQSAKRGLRILGSPVLGGGSDVVSLVRRHSIETILIAIPSATGAEMTRLLQLCHQAEVECKTVPSLGEMIVGGGLVRHIREVAVEDLLGRNPVHLQEDQIRAALEGKVVLITGAGGSIGSELCRQIARFQPAGIVGFEVAETPLFEVDRDMRQKFPQIPFYPEIGSIQNHARLDEVLTQYSPLIVYHAAAYKHVPLMEAHIFEAIENNVFGTHNMAMAAADHGVETFVLISSDKAVRSTSIMGASKRVAELLLPSIEGASTQYVAVRFGNVLGSNGSVIPIFKQQIAVGGPVTVTHPEMRRFFMTIPEACQLVLQAAVIGRGGQICVLDMGDPVKIVDLAKNLILLSGLRPDDDIKVEFSGIRPGEKLYEELSSLLENTIPTGHDKIRIFVGNGVREPDMALWLTRLREACRARDTGELVVTLKDIVSDYSPSSHLLRRVINSRNARAMTASS